MAEKITPSAAAEHQIPDIAQHFQPMPGTSTREELTSLMEDAGASSSADIEFMEDGEFPSLVPLPILPTSLRRGVRSTEAIRALRQALEGSPAMRVHPLIGRQAREHFRNIRSRVQQQLRTLYVRQYMRQETLRSYMTSGASYNNSLRTPLSATAASSAVPTSRFSPYPVHIVPSLYRLSASEMGISEVQQTWSIPLDDDDDEETTTVGLTAIEIHQNTTTMNLTEDLPDICVICMGGLVANECIRLLNCHHMFHQMCIDQWICTNGVCPTCRRSLRLPPLPESRKSTEPAVSAPPPPPTRESLVVTESPESPPMETEEPLHFALISTATQTDEIDLKILIAKSTQNTDIGE